MWCEPSSQANRPTDEPGAKSRPWLICPATVPPRKALAACKEAIQSRETRRDWIDDDEAWKEQGFPVGSGLVERAVAVAINLRMKKRCMRWKRANATAAVALRVHRINTERDAAASLSIVGGTFECKKLARTLSPPLLKLVHRRACEG